MKRAIATLARAMVTAMSVAVKQQQQGQLQQRWWANNGDEGSGNGNDDNMGDGNGDEAGGQGRGKEQGWQGQM